MTTTRPRTAFILLFRGVGGATQLPTAPLREALTGAGFENVATYINSGNAVLRSHLSREEVIAAVAEICKDRFGFTKAILAPTLEEWSALIDNNPFPQAAATPTCLHAAVLAGTPATVTGAALARPGCLPSESTLGRKLPEKLLITSTLSGHFSGPLGSTLAGPETKTAGPVA
jgi:hypothetical protein